MANQEKPIRVKHPSYGHVEFAMMSLRQKEILAHYGELLKLNNKHNDRANKRGLRQLQVQGF